MTTEIFDRLAEACDGRVALGTSEDAVCGLVPSYVAAPGSEGDVAALLRVADECGLSVTPRGAGTKLHWGPTPRGCELILDMSRFDRVIDHADGDMVVEVEAGCRLDRLSETLAVAGQRLAVDVPRYDDDTHAVGTVGGLIATGHAGPLRLSYGAVRDLLLGVTMVRADGVVARAGGRVVKNVAGYDLGKLLTGSFGTLGVVTSAIFRLHPLPEATAWVAVTTADPAGAARHASALIDSQQVPTTVDMDRPGVTAPITVAASFEGTAEGVAARAVRAAAAVDGKVMVNPVNGHAEHVAAGADSEVVAEPDPGGAATEPLVWHGSWPDSPHGTLVAVTVPPAALPAAMEAVAQAARANDLDVPARGSAVGVIHTAIPPEAEPGTVAAFVAALRDRVRDRDGSTVVVHAPDAVRQRVDMWGPVDDGALDLMRRVKNEFDPRHRLSPGRFVGRL